MEPLPSDKVLVEQIQVLLNKAHDDDTIGSLSRGQLRRDLAEHFGANFEAQKKKITAMMEEQNLLISTARREQKGGHASNSASASSVKAASGKPSKAKTQSETGKGKTPKRKRESAGSKFSDSETPQKDPVSTITISSDTSDLEPGSEDFSELEEDSHVRSHAQRSTATPGKKPSTTKTTSSSSSKRNSTSGNSSRRSVSNKSEAEKRLDKLKTLVRECGTHRQWKKLYEAAGVSEEDFEGQCKIVQSVLRELGMTGRNSLEQARKIKEEREFAEELAALQENEVIGADSRTRRTRASTGSGGRGAGEADKKPGARGKPLELSDDRTASSASESEFEEASNGKGRRRKAVSDSEEDGGPRKSKSFKSSLASFAAGLNSDSD